MKLEGKDMGVWILGFALLLLGQANLWLLLGAMVVFAWITLRGLRYFLKI